VHDHLGTPGDELIALVGDARLNGEGLAAHALAQVGGQRDQVAAQRVGLAFALGDHLPVGAVVLRRVEVVVLVGERPPARRVARVVEGEVLGEHAVSNGGIGHRAAEEVTRLDQHFDGLALGDLIAGRGDVYLELRRAVLGHAEAHAERLTGVAGDFGDDAVVAERRFRAEQQFAAERPLRRDGQHLVVDDLAPVVINLDRHFAQGRQRVGHVVAAAQDALEVHGLVGPVDGAVGVEVNAEVFRLVVGPRVELPGVHAVGPGADGETEPRALVHAGVDGRVQVAQAGDGRHGQAALVADDAGDGVEVLVVEDDRRAGDRVAARQIGHPGQGGVLAELEGDVDRLHQHHVVARAAVPLICLRRAGFQEVSAGSQRGGRLRLGGRLRAGQVRIGLTPAQRLEVVDGLVALGGPAGDAVVQAHVPPQVAALAVRPADDLHRLADGGLGDDLRAPVRLSADVERALVFLGDNDHVADGHLRRGRAQAFDVLQPAGAGVGDVEQLVAAHVPLAGDINRPAAQQVGGRGRERVPHFPLLRASEFGQGGQPQTVKAQVEPADVAVGDEDARGGIVAAVHAHPARCLDGQLRRVGGGEVGDGQPLADGVTVLVLHTGQDGDRVLGARLGVEGQGVAALPVVVVRVELAPGFRLDDHLVFERLEIHRRVEVDGEAAVGRGVPLAVEGRGAHDLRVGDGGEETRRVGAQGRAGRAECPGSVQRHLVGRAKRQPLVGREGQRAPVLAPGESAFHRLRRWPPSLFREGERAEVLQDEAARFQ